MTVYNEHMAKFVHLHTHSHFSLLSALPKIPELVAAAKADGMHAIALTDLGNLYGAIEFYKECRAQGIKPIIGVEAYTAARTRTDRQSGIDNRRGRLLLLAENLTGYKNLLKLVTASHLEGFYYRPRVDHELLKKYSDGLIAISPGYGGDISVALKNKNRERAEEIAHFYLDCFGHDNFFIEITHQSEVKGFDIAELPAFAKAQRIQFVAGHDIYYLLPTDKPAHNTIMSVQNNPDYGEISTADNGLDLSFLSQAQMEARFTDMPEALENTIKIANRCNLTLQLGKWVFPDYKTTNGRTRDDELRDIAYKGITRRHLTETPEVKKRIEYELKIIKDKGYAPYFLVVADLLEYGRTHHILTTTRGSAGGSLVSYLAFITTVNPLEYQLPFERFLNPERPSAPDIDMDIADNKRDLMIEYVKQKYGINKVAQVGTFGTMMARGAVRDVTRALGYEYAIGDKIAKLIPFGSQGFPMTIDHALEMIPELKKMCRDEKSARDIISMAKKIEGCARHISVHAAGVVISPTPLTDYLPLQYDSKGEEKIITQYDMHAVEDAGLLKFDFLGIKNLSILSDAVRLVEHIEKQKVDIENVPLDDKKTFEMLGVGATVGLFQLGGSGMTRYLKDLRPNTIHDINAMVALYRPGPMESIPKYIERKHNPALVSYLDPRLTEILAESYGVITYQDDVLLIAVKLGGYSWLEADKLRKAMGKKIPAEMEAQKEKLTTGFIKNGMTEQKAQDMWRLIEPFAAYGFGKAHAASYGKVAYQTAYMKANFPAIYMSAVLTADSGDVEKIAETIAECKRIGIPVLPPDVNESFEGFTVVKSTEAGGSDKIRFGLSTIKNFGEGISKSIIDERKSGGKFKSLGDFLERIQNKNLNKKSLESLTKCGAMDSLGERGAILSNLEQLLEYHKEHATSSKDQSSLFAVTGSSSVSNVRLAKANEATVAEKLTWEKELLGLYISGHPLDKFKDILEKREVNVRRIKEEYREGMQVVLGGIVEEAKQIITKSNHPMVFARLADLSGSIEAVVFPKIYKEAKDLLVPEKCIAVKGRVSVRNGETSIIVEQVRALDISETKLHKSAH